MHAEVDPRSTILLVIDLQKAFTDSDSYLAKHLFNGEVSATEEKLTEIADFAMNCQEKQIEVIVTRIVHDLDKMKQLDPNRFDQQIIKSLIDFKGGKPVPLICAPDSADTELDFGISSFAPPKDRVFDKCSRSILKDPLLKNVVNEKYKAVLLTGLDSNVCIYESAKDLMKIRDNVFILENLVSTRPSDQKDAGKKFEELKNLGVKFLKSSEIDFHL